MKRSPRLQEFAHLDEDYLYSKCRRGCHLPSTHRQPLLLDVCCASSVLRLSVTTKLEKQVKASQCVQCHPAVQPLTCRTETTLAQGYAGDRAQVLSLRRVSKEASIGRRRGTTEICIARRALISGRYCRLDWETDCPSKGSFQCEGSCGASLSRNDGKHSRVKSRTSTKPPRFSIAAAASGRSLCMS